MQATHAAALDALHGLVELEVDNDVHTPVCAHGDQERIHVHEADIQTDRGCKAI
jgi:hypothetical protein